MATGYQPVGDYGGSRRSETLASGAERCWPLMHIRYARFDCLFGRVGAFTPDKVPEGASPTVPPSHARCNDSPQPLRGEGNGWVAFKSHIWRCAPLQVWEKISIMSRIAQFRHKALDAISGHRVVFHHMAKCGGTSVARALRLRYVLSYSYFELRAIYSAMEALHPDYSPERVRDESVRFREEQLLYYMYDDVRCITGHVPFSDTAFREFSGRYRFITTIREPISLFISTFFYNATSTDDRWKIESSIEEFLNSPRARLFGEVYARFFGGVSMEGQGSSSDLLENAKSNLKKFSAVGLTEDMASFERRLREVLGIRLRIGHENRSRVSDAERRDTMTPEVRRKIEELSAPNIEIYDFVKTQLAT